MAVLVDTGPLIDAERGTTRLDEIAPDDDRVISVVTVSELLHGAARATPARAAARRAFVEHVIGVYEALPITQAVARLHAEIWSDLLRRGEMIGLHDLWIATTAVAHGAAVVTKDVRDFSRVPGLRVVGLTG